MKQRWWLGAMALGAMAMGAPAMANPGYSSYWYHQPVVFPYRQVTPFAPSPVLPRGGVVYVAPLHSPVVLPSAVTVYPYVNYNSRTGFSYGFTALPAVNYPVVGGYATPLYGPGFVIYPNAHRY